jgi:hypothetical protein
MISWFRQLESARGPLEVVAIARDYFASWSPRDIARLPDSCRPRKLRDESDIEVLHGHLVEEYRVTRASGDDLRLLQELTSFLVRASMRIADLAGEASKGGAGHQGSEPVKSAARDN